MKKDKVKTVEASNSVQKSKKRRKHKKAPVIFAVAAILLIVVKLVSCGGAGTAGIMVTTTYPIRGDLQDSISTSGTVESEEVKVLFAPATGTIGCVNAETGDAVKAGELLVGYDMQEMEASLRQSELQLQRSMAGYEGIYARNAENLAKLNEANRNLEVLRQQIADYEAYLTKLQNGLEKNQRETSNALAAENYNLSEKLKGLEPGSDEYKEVSSQLSRNNYLQQVASSSDYVAETQAEIARVREEIADCEAYKAQMENQKSTSEAAVLSAYDKTQQETDRELADMTYLEAEEEYVKAQAGIIAEFDGIITESSVVSGAGVTRGMQLMTLESSENVKVSFRASRYDVEKLEIGQKAQITISGRVYEGEVAKIDRMAMRNESNTPMVGAEIHILNADDKIILGMDAKLLIYTQKTENALLIPMEAINADKNGDFLYVAENGIAVRKPIVCGISGDSYTEVLEGITEQDAIILTASGNLEEGMAVTVIQDTPVGETNEDKASISISVGQ